MLLTSGEAPFCSSSRTMFRWPMKAATWIGVKPDWTQCINMKLNFQKQRLCVRVSKRAVPFRYRYQVSVGCQPKSEHQIQFDFMYDLRYCLSDQKQSILLFSNRWLWFSLQHSRRRYYCHWLFCDMLISNWYHISSYSRTNTWVSYQK